MRRASAYAPHCSNAAISQHRAVTLRARRRCACRRFVDNGARTRRTHLSSLFSHFKRYLDAEDLASSPRDAVDIAVRACRACVSFRTLDQLKFNVSAAQRHAADLETRPAVGALLHAFSAIHHLGAHLGTAANLKAAARACRSVDAVAWRCAVWSNVNYYYYLCVSAFYSFPCPPLQR